MVGTAIVLISTVPTVCSKDDYTCFGAHSSSLICTLGFERKMLRSWPGVLPPDADTWLPLACSSAACGQ